MKLAANSEARYLRKPKAHSRAGRHYFLSDNSAIPPNNGAVPNIAHIIKHVKTLQVCISCGKRGNVHQDHPRRNGTCKATNNASNRQPDGWQDIKRKDVTQKNKGNEWTWDSIGYNYWTKHHAATHHQNVQKEFLTPHRTKPSSGSSSCIMKKE